MTAVSITPAVALSETRAELEHFRTRSLVQAQAIADLQAQVAAQASRIAELEGRGATDSTEVLTEEPAHG